MYIDFNLFLTLYFFPIHKNELLLFIVLCRKIKWFFNINFFVLKIKKVLFFDLLPFYCLIVLMAFLIYINRNGKTNQRNALNEHITYFVKVFSIFCATKILHFRSFFNLQRNFYVIAQINPHIIAKSYFKVPLKQPTLLQISVSLR